MSTQGGVRGLASRGGVWPTAHIVQHQRDGQRVVGRGLLSPVQALLVVKRGLPEVAHLMKGGSDPITELRDLRRHDRGSFLRRRSFRCREAFVSTEHLLCRGPNPRSHLICHDRVKGFEADALLDQPKNAGSVLRARRLRVLRVDCDEEGQLEWRVEGVSVPRPPPPPCPPSREYPSAPLP